MARLLAQLIVELLYHLYKVQPLADTAETSHVPILLKDRLRRRLSDYKRLRGQTDYNGSGR